MSIDICFLELSEEFLMDAKINSNYRGKRAIGARAIEVRL